MEKLVDIIPKISPVGGFTKIYDSSPYNFNNKVMTLLNYLEYEENKNSIFPDMGGYRTLYKIPYSEKPENVVMELSTKISKFLNFSIEISYEYEENKDIVLNFTIANLPGELKMNMRNVDGFVKLVNPRYIK